MPYKRKDFTLEQLVKFAKDVAKKIGKTPSKFEYDQFRAKEAPSEFTIRRKGRAWSEVSEAAFGSRKKQNTLHRDNINKEENDSNLTGRRRYFITAAVAGAQVHESFLDSIKTYCKTNDSKLVILPMKGCRTGDKEYDDRILSLVDNFVTYYKFNNNLIAVDMRINPQQINPLTGLNRIGQKKYSVIIASPKQQMQTVPTSNAGWPHILHSTGVITRPNYNNDRTGLLAEQDHVVGGLIVEIENNQIFHIRQIQARTDGCFYDLNYLYTPKKKSQHTDTEAFILGDIHAGEEDDTALKAWKEAIKVTKPKRLIFHDLFSGQSVNHHEEHNMTAKSNRPEDARTLEKELDLTANTIHTWRKEFPKTEFVVVASNHDEFLSRYLSEGRYVKDAANYRLSLELAICLCDGKNPIREYITEKFGEVKNTSWLIRDEDYKVIGVQLGAHGDLGSNGSKGGINNLEIAYGNAITGHTHTPGILRNLWIVGTTTKLKLRYNRGPSSWLHASAILYSSGQKQMIVSVNGKWRI